MEGLRFFDLRRWKVAEKTVAVSGEGMNGEVYGAFMRLDGVGATDRTVTVDGVPRRYVETYKFDPSKHYLFPVPSKDIDLTNGSLTQNRDGAKLDLSIVINIEGLCQNGVLIQLLLKS